MNDSTRARIGHSLRTVLASATIAILAACGGGGSGTSPQVPVAVATCNPSIPAAMLLYPIPGATNVPANGLTMIVAAHDIYKFHLMARHGSGYVKTSPTTLPSPLPQPRRSQPDGTELVAIAAHDLSGQTNYVASVIGFVDVCDEPMEWDKNLGAFTTQ